MCIRDRNEFEPYAAFIRIDRHRNGYLTAADIEDYLRSNNRPLNEKSCYLFIKQYDRDRDHRLVFSEFLHAVLPQNNPELRTVAAQRPNYDVRTDEYLTHDIEFTLSILRRADTDDDGQLTRKEFEAYFSPTQYPSPLSDRSIKFQNLQEVAPNVSLVSEQIRARVKTPERRARSPSPMASPSRAAANNNNNNDNVKLSISNMRSTMDSLPEMRQSASKSYVKELASTNRSSTYQSPTRTTGSASALRNSYNNSSDELRGYSSLQSSEKVAVTNSAVRGRDLGSADRYYSEGQSVSRRLFSDNIVSGRPVDGSLRVEIVEALHGIIKIDQDAEIAKQHLALRQDFNLFDAFRIFDLDQRGSLLAGELESGLKSISVAASRDDIYLLLRRYNYRGDGKFSFSEFADMLTPLEPEYSSLLNSRTPSRRRVSDAFLDLFSSETQRLIINVFNKLIEAELSCEASRRRLQKSPGVSIGDAFRLLDKDQDGNLNHNDIRLSFGDAGNFVTEKDLDHLFDRINLKRDGKISYGEFINELNPKLATFF
eukprot:TRINITY_DN4877_c0_g1_i10.p1 TRINITY_DN4877_c0_g1~~TRINITY_DN4877_c0_g1_i10.p1  ORF type:complete len:566 (+),score=122.17 TRINITY_DN4877_c0_g1_i10:78-1700(+)